MTSCPHCKDPKRTLYLSRDGTMRRCFECQVVALLEEILKRQWPLGKPR